MLMTPVLIPEVQLGGGINEAVGIGGQTDTVAVTPQF